jgi:aminoglycoside phosphotransferase (APT) family kinase protein
LWALPNDPALPQLPALLDPERVVLEQPLARLGADPRRLEVALLRYVPQRRASLRYTLAPEPGGIARTLHAKTFFDTRAPAIHERFEWFWQLSQRDASAPRVAAPLGHDAHTIWQEGLVGTPLTAHLEGDTASIMRATAGALAHLHDAPLGPSPTATPHTSEHWMHEVRLRLKKLARVDESLGERVQTVVDALEATAAHQQARPLSLIHGDFHHDQFWVDDDGRLIMFDFDEFNRGDPMEDLAEFLTKLEPLDIAGHRRAALVEHYAAITSRYDARSLQWHLTIQSLLQATRAFVYQQPGWKVALSQRLDRTLSHAALLG